MPFYWGGLKQMREKSLDYVHIPIVDYNNCFYADPNSTSGLPTISLSQECVSGCTEPHVIESTSSNASANAPLPIPIGTNITWVALYSKHSVKFSVLYAVHVIQLLCSYTCTEDGFEFEDAGTNELTATCSEIGWVGIRNCTRRKNCIWFLNL